VNHPIHHKDQHGFSLVELMVAMVLGLIVLGGTISIFSGTMESTKLNQSLTQLQSNARFATQLISNDLRMAGYIGCASNTTGNLVANWAPGKPDNYTAPLAAGAPVVGTHVLMVQYALAPGNRLLSSMSGRGSTIELQGDNADLTQSSLAVISNCNNGELFSVGYRGGMAGNTTISPESSLSQAYLYNEKSPEAVRVMPFKTVMYYVGNTGRTSASGDEIDSLYMQTFPYDLDDNPPIEIVEGVEQLQLNMGVRVDGGYEFHAPDSATLDFSDVDMVQVGLLLTTRDRFAESAVNRPYYLADTLVSVEGSGAAVTYPDDNRIRMAYNLSVNVRNRSQ